MKLYFLFIVICTYILFSSCDNRIDYFGEVNKPPILKLYRNGVVLTDSTFSDSIKIGQNYFLRYNISDEEKIGIKVKLMKPLITIDFDNELLIFTGVAEGQNSLTMIAEDSFHKKAEVSILLTVFRNIPPVARFTVKKIGISSPYEYEIDASSSYDRDKRFNGEIVEYEYTLANYRLNTTLNKIRYVFGTFGQKNISVRVKDNNGDWSGLVSGFSIIF